MRLFLRRFLLILLVLVFPACFAANNSSLPSLDIKRLLSEYKELPKEIIKPLKVAAEEDSLKETLRILWMEKVMGFRVTRMRRGNACLSNQKVIMAALDLYNMEHPKLPIRKFSDADVTDHSGRLVAGKYIKTVVSRPEVNCEYCYYGSTDNGLVYCKVHGTIPEYQEAIAKELNIELPSDKADKMIKIAFMGGLIFIAVLLIALKFLRKKSKDTAE